MRAHDRISPGSPAATNYLQGQKTDVFLIPGITGGNVLKSGTTYLRVFTVTDGTIRIGDQHLSFPDQIFGNRLIHRSEERREGKECVSTGRSRWWRET